MTGVILVATHKKSSFPVDSLYLPIQVGRDEVDFDLGIQTDNTGENISYKHRYYSDLSSVFWGWKNIETDFIGCCHYRRYFVSHTKKTGEKNYRFVLNRQEIESLLKVAPIIIPKKRRYYIETIESHYKHTHTSEDFDLLRDVIKKSFPEYADCFEMVARSRSAHLFNCYIMEKSYFDSFCSFLFSVLFEVERKIDFSNRNEYDSRTCGYLAEFLLDTWLKKTGYKYIEKRLKVFGKKRLLKKGFAFLNAKFFGKKYDKSF